MPMPHRTFAQLAKRRLVGKEGRERIREVNALLAELPDYKNGPYADLRKWLTSEIEESRVRSNAVHRDSIAVRREGAAQIALVGPPNVGKSSILQALSEIQIKTGDYPFTTLRPIPALTRIGGVLVQLVEIPGLIEGANDDRGGGRALLGVLRSADAIVYCTRADADPELRPVRAEVTLAGIDKPAVPRRDTRRRGAPGAIDGSGGVSGPRGRPGVGDRRGQPRGLPRRRVAPDRADPRLPPNDRRAPTRSRSRSIPARPSRTSPTGSTTTSRRRFIGARVWGPSARFDGQRVGRDHAVHDGDVVRDPAVAGPTLIKVRGFPRFAPGGAGAMVGPCRTSSSSTFGREREGGPR